MQQLNPPIPQYCVGDGFFPEGMCFAHFIIDYSQEHNILWVCTFDKGGAWYTIPNELIRAQQNRSLGRLRC